MPSADTETTDDAEDTAVTDEGRSALLEALTEEMGEALVASHLAPGQDLWIRVATDAWSDTADYLHNRQRFRFFDWLSAIDWMQSPFGRSLDAEVDKVLAPASEGDEASDDDDEFTGTGADGVTGGDTRFQTIARVYSLTTKLGVTIKADVGNDLTIGTWTHEYPGADWHEREAWEMYGITFSGHPGLRHLYLPGDFEGHPLRKDYPLLARLVKPWPGLVDVELMPPPPDVANEVPPGAEPPEEADETPAPANEASDSERSERQ